jgi:exosome complex component RRP40
MQVNTWLINNIVLPGDVVATITNSSQIKKPIRIGDGITQRDNRILAEKSGYLRHLVSSNKFFIESNQRTYNQLATDDVVIGVIKERAGENYKVDINSPYSAIMSLMAFDGATKRNRPDLKPGSLIYARMLSVNRDMDPELTCVSSSASQRKDWVTGLSMFGELKDGYMIHVDTALCRYLLQSDNEFLKKLGEKVPFEIAVGLNGRVWVSALTQQNPVRDTILIANSIQKIPLSKYKK